MICLLLLALPYNNEAFSSSRPPRLPLRRMLDSQVVLNAATLDNVAESPPGSSLLDDMVPDLLHELSPSSSPSGAMAPPVATPASPSIASSESIQTRSLDLNLDADAIINASAFLLIAGIVLECLLSVDVGISRGWTPAEMAERVPLDVWRSYSGALAEAPLRTKAMTSAAVYAIGDVVAQTKGEGREIGELDRGRATRSLLAGFVGHGPMCHVWYRVSEDFFDDVLGLHAWWDFVPKVVVDQLVFGPIWNNSYILLLGLMQWQNPGKIWEDMKRTTIPLVVSGLKLWPFVHCITYGLIPVENRLLWVDAVEIVWVTILSSEASGNADDNAVDKKEAPVVYKGKDDIR